MVICTLASGSDGNSILIGHNNTYLLVDAGISAKQTDRSLREFGISVSNLACVLVTHEHVDHIRGLGVLHKPVFAAPLTAASVRKKSPLLSVEDITGDFSVGDIGITPFHTPHDTPDSLGFLFDLSGFRVCVCTDLGHITQTVLDHACKADALWIESNHDEAMVRSGRYPAFLKRRILGPNGHLSNEASADAVLAAVRGGAKYITLCHLSKENNRPELAEGTTAEYLSGHGVAVGLDAVLNTAPPGVPGIPLRI